MNDQLVTVEMEWSSTSLLVRLSGEIDLSNSHELHQELETAIAGSSRAVIDLAEIKYLDSQGLRLLKQLCDQVGKAGTELQLVAPPDGFARQVLEMGRIGDYVEIRDTLEG